tara:strand:- start:540 stop:1196 length:657 start_codon:yes stop_codon:yes gene_type:complete
MHSIFVFLIDDGNLQDGAMDRSEATDIVQSAFLREYEPFLDEDNWYETMAVLFQDGTIWSTCDPDRGHRDFVSDIEERYPDRSERWGWGLKFATGCVALDMRFRDSTSCQLIPNDARKEIDGMSYEELVKAINEEVPQELSKSYANVSELEPSDGFDLESYTRQKKSTGFEKFNTSQIKPFAIDRETPYSYRCFDLRRDSSGTEPSEDTVMLFVDIHT